MRRTYPSKKIEEENRRLKESFLSDTDDTISLDEFVERNASDEFKKYLKKARERKKSLWEEKGEIEE